ncbi:MAG: DoxX family protein, partial [Halobaculum sp.]
AVAPVVIRAGLGVNFLYLGITQKWLQPGEALAVVAQYDLTSVVPVAPELWVFGAGLVEAGVGLLFLAGCFTRGAATAGFLLLTTTLFGLPNDPVLAHVTLFGLSSALMVTGSGPYSLDADLIPRLHDRLAVRPTDDAAPAPPSGD